MDPFDPFAGFPGDPMEQVLSLQTFNSAVPVPGPVPPAPCNFTNACRICGDTYSCDTLGCTLSCPIGPGEVGEEPGVDGW